MKKTLCFLIQGLLILSLWGCSATPESQQQAAVTPTPETTVAGQGNTPGNSMNEGYMAEGEFPYYFCVEKEGIMKINQETGEKTLYAKPEPEESFSYLNWAEGDLYALSEIPSTDLEYVRERRIVRIQPSGERQILAMPETQEPLSFSTAGGAIYALTGDALLQISIKPENYGKTDILAEPGSALSRMTTGVPIANEEAVYYIALNQQTGVGEDVTYRKLEAPETQGSALTGMSITRFFVQGNDLYAYEGGKDVYKIDLKTGEKQAMGFAEHSLEGFNVCENELYYIQRTGSLTNMEVYKKTDNGKDPLIYSIPPMKSEGMGGNAARPCKLYEIYGTLCVYDTAENQVLYTYQKN